MFGLCVCCLIMPCVALNSGEVLGCSDDFKGLMSMPSPGALNIKKHLGHVKRTGNLKGQCIKMFSSFTTIIFLWNKKRDKSSSLMTVTLRSFSCHYTFRPWVLSKVIFECRFFFKDYLDVNVL